jgi:pyruvate,water dikinase
MSMVEVSGLKKQYDDRYVVDNISFSVKKGEILIASMTRPEFLPAMQKAAAFVTDEGGITSHAAIVSREMKKPCIIGTKIATKVFKDGDMVEVDANKGIVRKL